MEANIESNLVWNIERAFEKYYSHNTDLRIRCEEQGVAWKCPEVKVNFDGKVLSVEGTRIRFDLWSYAYQGYQQLAQFIEACWNDPLSVIDELVIAGIFDVSPFRMSFCSSYDYDSFLEVETSLYPEEWEEGSIVTIGKGIFAPHRNGKFTLKAPCYEVRPFFGCKPEVRKGIYLPPCTFVVKEVDCEGEWFHGRYDNDMWQEFTLSGSGEIINDGE